MTSGDEFNYLTEDEAVCLLRFLETGDEKFREIRDICAMTLIWGTRRSEILGIRNKDVDFDHNVAKIRHTVVRCSTVVEKDRTKTRSSARTYTLNAETRGILEKITEWQKKNGYYRPDGHVFIRFDGRDWDPDRLSKVVKQAVKICQRNGEIDPDKRVGLHQLRDTCVSTMFRHNVPVDIIGRYIGHSPRDLEVLRRHYLHVEQDSVDAYADQLMGVYSTDRK